MFRPACAFGLLPCLVLTAVSHAQIEAPSIPRIEVIAAGVTAPPPSGGGVRTPVAAPGLNDTLAALRPGNRFELAFPEREVLNCLVETEDRAAESSSLSGWLESPRLLPSACWRCSRPTTSPGAATLSSPGSSRCRGR